MALPLCASEGPAVGGGGHPAAPESRLSGVEGPAVPGHRRSDVVALLDRIEDAHGAKQADYVLSAVRSIMNWFATRHDDYMPPLVRGIRRTDPKARQRARILNDEELRAVCAAAEKSGTFGAMVRFALLTAQRRENVATTGGRCLRPTASGPFPRTSGRRATPGALPARGGDRDHRSPARLGTTHSCLPAAVRVHSPASPRARRRSTPGSRRRARKPGCRLCRSGSSMTYGEPRRSLMSRAGVRSDVAERIMGHAIPGVEGFTTVTPTGTKSGTP